MPQELAEVRESIRFCIMKFLRCLPCREILGLFRPDDSRCGLYDGDFFTWGEARLSGSLLLDEGGDRVVLPANHKLNGLPLALYRGMAECCEDLGNGAIMVTLVD